MGRIMVSLLLTVCACVFSILNTEAKPQYGDWWANNRAPQYGDWWANNRGQYGNYGPMFRRQPPNYMNWWARPTPSFLSMVLSYLSMVTMVACGEDSLGGAQREANHMQDH